MRALSAGEKGFEPMDLGHPGVRGEIVKKEAVEDGAASRRGEGHIRLSLGAEGDEAVLRIQDDGPGLSAAVAEHIFEPFVTSKPRGSGLGLFVVDQLVRRMGGRVRLVPGSEQGTVAEVRLKRNPPLVSKAKKSHREVLEAEDPHG